LAWADAARYELTVAHDSAAASRYARAAETIASYIYRQPHACRSGGIDFERGHTPNTLTNAQFIALTAELARLRDTPGPLLDAGKGRAWLADADSILSWMQSSGLVNMVQGTVRYGYDGSCRPYGATQTNTEGEMAEALVALGQAAHRPQLVNAAAVFLDRVMSPGLGMLSGGVLQEPCESWRRACAGSSYNITVFKGVLDRAVRDWSEATGSVAFEWFLAAQARAVIAHAASNGEKAAGCQTPRSCVLGMYWARSISPARQPKLPNAGSQAAGLEALTSALVVGVSDPASGGREGHDGVVAESSHRRTVVRTARPIIRPLLVEEADRYVATSQRPEVVRWLSPRSPIRAPRGGEVEIGWHLHPDSWGNDFASEAPAASLQPDTR
jgi:hypothetical protein